jgi:hypothetical protein
VQNGDYAPAYGRGSPNQDSARKLIPSSQSEPLLTRVPFSIVTAPSALGSKPEPVIVMIVVWHR